jgi:hypothetical protein
LEQFAGVGFEPFVGVVSVAFTGVAFRPFTGDVVGSCTGDALKPLPLRASFLGAFLGALVNVLSMFDVWRMLL